MTETTGLKRAMEAAERPAPSQLTDPQRLIATARRLLLQQQERLINERGKYEAERTSRANWYRSEMAKIADEAEAEMASTDKEWAKLEAEVSLTIRQIKALLSAG